jgi:hypothetical protein
MRTATRLRLRDGATVDTFRTLQAVLRVSADSRGLGVPETARREAPLDETGFAGSSLLGVYPRLFWERVRKWLEIDELDSWDLAKSGEV